jgi:hypothetical protein
MYDSLLKAYNILPNLANLVRLDTRANPRYYRANKIVRRMIFWNPVTWLA